jgi:hypothetical protein
MRTNRSVNNRNQGLVFIDGKGRSKEKELAALLS